MTCGSRRTADTLPPSLPTRETSTARAAVVAVLALLLGVVAGLGASVGTSNQPAAAITAQAAGSDGDQPSIRIMDQSTFVPADGSFDVVVDLELPPSFEASGGSPFLSVTFFGRLSSERAVEEPPTEALKRTPAIAIDRAPRTQAGDLRLSIPIRSASRFDDQDRVLLPEPGVYPVTVELRDADGPLASVRTHLVRQPIETADEPSEDSAPLEVAILLNLTTAEGLTAPEAAVLLAEHPSLPITAVLDPGVMTQLRSDPAIAAALAEALNGRPVLTTPTIDLDPSALAEIGQGDLYLAAAEADRQALLALGLQPADGIALLSSPLTPAGLDLLLGQGVGTVLDLGDQLLGSGIVGTGNGSIDLIRPNRDLDEALGGGGGAPQAGSGPHRANQVLARLTLRRELDDRPVVLGGSAIGVDPAPALASFLGSLSQPGAPRPVPLSAIDAGPRLRPAEQPTQDLGPVADIVTRIQERLTTYASFNRSGGPVPAEYRQRLVGALTLQRNPEDRVRALEVIAGQLDDDFDAIHIHQPQPVTLAARSASIPLVIENNASGPRHVILRFRGDRVTSADDGRLLRIEPGTQSIDIEVEARSLGVSPLEVMVWTPDGSVPLADARFEIRSTAVPGLGLLVSLSALALLGVWWVVDHRKRRRDDVIIDTEPERVRGETPDRQPTTV